MLLDGENRTVISSTLCSEAENQQASFSAKDGAHTALWPEQKDRKGRGTRLLAGRQPVQISGDRI